MSWSVKAVILNYRQSELTIRCIGSLIDQVEFIVVVDNSESERDELLLLKAVKTIRKKIGSDTVEVVNPHINLGFAKGVQYGIDNPCNPRFQWDAVLVINNDVVASAGMIKQLKVALDLHGGNAVAVPRASLGSTPTMLWYQRLFGLVTERRLPGSFSYITGACLLVPRSLANPYLFDPEFFMYGEDVELSWRMRKASVPFVIADTECTHEGSASSRLGSLFYEYNVVVGHLILAKKLTQSILGQILFTAARVPTLLLRATRRSLRQKRIAPWQALLRALLGKVVTDL